MLGALDQLPAVLKALGTAGLKPSREAQRWLDLAAAINACREVPPAPEIADLLDGDDVPAAIDAAVRSTVDRTARLQVTAELGGRAAGLALAAIRGDADRLIGELRPAFDRAAANLVAAALDVTVDQIGDAGALIRAGGRAADAAGEIIEASRELDAILDARIAITGQPAEVDQVVASFDGDWWRWTDAAEAFGKQDRWHLLAESGLALRLNATTEVAELVRATPERQMVGAQVRVNAGSAVVGYTQTRVHPGESDQ